MCKGDLSVQRFLPDELQWAVACYVLCSPGLWKGSLALKTVVKKPKGNAPMPKDMWKPVSLKPWNLCAGTGGDTKASIRKNPGIKSNSKKTAAFTDPSSALRFCSLALRSRWSFQPERWRTTSGTAANTWRRLRVKSKLAWYLGSSWLALPLPYSGMTFSLLMPALQTGHCCLLGRISSHWGDKEEDPNGFSSLQISGCRVVHVFVTTTLLKLGKKTKNKKKKKKNHAWSIIEGCRGKKCFLLFTDWIE